MVLRGVFLAIFGDCRGTAKEGTLQFKTTLNLRLPRTILLSTIFLLCAITGIKAQTIIRGTVVDSGEGSPVIGAAVSVGGNIWSITDTLGHFTLKVGKVSPITITSLGYKSLTTESRPDGVYRLEADIAVLSEVIVTAQENHGLTSSSRIGEDAISHIQPSSFADVLELLPGGRASDPALSSPQIINLRAAGSLSGNYATSALGTSFLVDGKPIGNNANLQYSPAYSSLGGDYVNLGTDMRTISTEDIESVDVVRGIASVQYGDLTSGLIKINRKKGSNDLRARFKADMKSKLLYGGKGFEWGTTDKITLNASLNYLDSQADPRNSRQNWKRVTASLRGGMVTNSSDKWRTSANLSLDYTGSFDDVKSDKDLDTFGGGPVETYKSTYNKFALGADYSISSKDRDSFFRSLTAQLSLTLEKDLIDRWRHNAFATESPISVSREAGEFDAIMVPRTYDATLRVDGRPMYAFANVVSSFHTGIHTLKAGAEWNMDKNFGEGSIFDPSLPFNTSMSARPRAYSDIPSNHQLSAFAEQSGELPLGEFRLEWAAGLRGTMLLGAGSEYEINAKPFLDPRVNVRVNFPQVLLGGYPLKSGIYSGAGSHSKFPTMDQLYPEPIYGDIGQLNYWPTETSLRRINLLVYKVDPTNFSLSVARNLKWEIGVDADWNGCTFSVDYFTEDMTSGFRSSSEYMTVEYRRFDISGIDKSTLTGPPSLDEVPFTKDTLLTAFSRTTNGSRSLKQGVEFTFSSKRIRSLGTKITANGAYFRTRYMNSQPEYYRPSVMIAGKQYPYIGLYDKNDGTLYESLSTNLMLDTQIPSLGLIFSTSFQCQWFTGHQSMEDDPRPISYLDNKLISHPFTEESAQDGVLRLLVRDYTASLFEYTLVPFSMNVNLKVTKKLYHDKASCSLFVNRIFDVTPDYYRNEALVRRNVVPYFGMEVDFKI